MLTIVSILSAPREILPYLEFFLWSFCGAFFTYGVFFREFFFVVERRNVRRTSSMSPQSQAHGTPMKGVESYPYKVNERLYKDDVCAPTPFASSLPAPLRNHPPI